MNFFQKLFQILRINISFFLAASLLAFIGIVVVTTGFKSNLLPQTRQLNAKNNAISYGYNIDYSFILNISQFPFFGNWESLDFKENQFSFEKGETIIYFYKIPNEKYISTIEDNNTTFSMSFYLKDGKYIDYFFRGNFSLYIPYNFSSLVEEGIKFGKNVTLSYKNIKMNYFSGEYLDEYTASQYNNTNINITFIPEEKIFNNKDLFEVSSNLFSKINVFIKNEEKKFSVVFNGEMYNNEKYPIQVLNYSICLTLISLLQIYQSINFLMSINENTQVGLNIDLYTVSIQIMWDAVVCAVHFFLAISNEEMIYEYAMPSIAYFFLFSIFQLRILFMAWKTRYNDLIYNDPNLFRKKLFQFYSMFYCMLFLSLITIRFWYNNFYLSYLIFLGTWIFQIYHSASKGTKPPMSFSYIFVFTVAKLFFPLYIKGYNNNFLQFRPAYCKVLIIFFTLVIESIIISLQKIIGPKFIVPKCLKKDIHQYYIDINEIPNSLLECAICLEYLEKKPIVEKEKVKQQGYMQEKLLGLVEMLKEHKLKKDFMVTPCHHYFHTPCLEKWMEMKNECPCCRSKIPPLDE